MIYIDPPYNTRNKDFKYDDNYVEKEDAFRHSKWLSFISKKLVIARKILKTSGVIFISIDDYEYAELQLLYELCNNQTFPVLRIGSRILIPIRTFEDWRLAVFRSCLIDRICKKGKGNGNFVCGFLFPFLLLVY